MDGEGSASAVLSGRGLRLCKKRANKENSVFVGKRGATRNGNILMSAKKIGMHGNRVAMPFAFRHTTRAVWGLQRQKLMTSQLMPVMAWLLHSDA